MQLISRFLKPAFLVLGILALIYIVRRYLDFYRYYSTGYAPPSTYSAIFQRDVLVAEQSKYVLESYHTTDDESTDPMVGKKENYGIVPVHDGKGADGFYKTSGKNWTIILGIIALLYTAGTMVGIGSGIVHANKRRGNIYKTFFDEY